MRTLPLLALLLLSACAAHEPPKPQRWLCVYGTEYCVPMNDAVYRYKDDTWTLPLATL